MPRVKLVLFQETDGNVPLLDWLAEQSPKARAKCDAWLEQLRAEGHECDVRSPTICVTESMNFASVCSASTIGFFTSFTVRR
jgi:hypothetical protein